VAARREKRERDKEREGENDIERDKENESGRERDAVGEERKRKGEGVGGGSRHGFAVMEEKEGMEELVHGGGWVQMRAVVCMEKFVACVAIGSARGKVKAQCGGGLGSRWRLGQWGSRGRSGGDGTPVELMAELGGARRRWIHARRLSRGRARAKGRPWLRRRGEHGRRLGFWGCREKKKEMIINRERDMGRAYENKIEGKI